MISRQHRRHTPIIIKNITGVLRKINKRNSFPNVVALGITTSMPEGEFSQKKVPAVDIMRVMLLSS